jgi:TonB family protein
VEVQVQADHGPDLLLHWNTRPESRTFVRLGVASLAVHVVLITLLVLVSNLPDPPPLHGPRITADLSKAVHLVIPLTKLTQKEPNPGKVAKEMNVESLQAKVNQERVPQPPKRFTAPPQPPPQAAPPKPQPQVLPDPPKIEANMRNPLPQIGLPQAPPPRTTEEPPKIALETPGQNGIAVQRMPGQTRIPPPKTSVDDAIRSVVHGSGQGGGISVGDEEQTPTIRDQLRQSSKPGQVQSSLHMLSDDQGVDFKPYLIRVLAMVRRNWLAIIPESAHMGRRGRVLLQFIVDRSGAVPKLVIAMPSGTEAFDRAAVAGISASVPLPPLPPEFKGSEVRLEFSFKYNMK